MTLEEFAEYWGISKAYAQSYLSRFSDIKKENGHYIYDPEKIKKAHELKLISSIPKQENEYDIDDIYKKLQNKIGYNKLNKLVKSAEFPEIKRACFAGSNNKRLWDKKAVYEFFNDYSSDFKKIPLKSRKRVRTIDGIKAAFILFNSGMTHKITTNKYLNITNVITTRFRHCSLLESMKD
jgi:hypothetical protein